MGKIVDTKMKFLVDALVKSYYDNVEIIKFDTAEQLNRSLIIELTEKLRCLIFPGYFGKKNISGGLIEYHTGELLDDVNYNLTKQIARALRFQNPPQADEDLRSARASELSFAFLSTLPDLRDVLATDVSAAYDGDPAAYNKDEIISSYPGIYAITVNRLAHELYKLGVPLIPRIMTEHAHNITGIDIHPGATIGHHFFIDHGTGIVIGETTIIGNFVKLYQGVTLGALSTRGGQVLKEVKRHPTIEDHVTIYSGASILGGNTIIGEGVVIGSNAFVTKSVPEKTKVSVKNPELQFMSDEQQNKWEHKEFQQDGVFDYMI
ncbi:serine acetyltransferase, plasmid [Treponema primitia ZAS-2]|uniref:Serine acetyltransferase, plasmid n=1 Tax=Treponema primitia (strain ATCC BAA-887 / DSM 12427 / ZAS-2) TaxID=545694 RepID=F5YQC0_TREPZ|nr:serine O-acetyltransferase EpsC [Treponema primitia]AEF86726.1 serine acetyltransferase, plasmid [Treponema primitia ZAS-2]